ncbi:MAG: proprotein convertase P-domain-containing protein [Phycisphaeraceae bacterium]|nr:MAG: proprotein convertase P-domain-containing protein [Phycisphaeraceae bacterium]
MRLTVIGFLCALAGAASAQAVYTGPGGSIPDNGGPGSPFSSSITVSDSYAITDLQLNINDFTHTFVGDLIITLSHGATSLTVVDRPGVPEWSSFGWAYNLNGNYTFSDDASVDWDNILGGVQDTNFNIPSGSYLPENPLSAFDGSNVNGLWTLTISDNAGADLGAVGSWGLTVRSVPTPASIGLLGAAGLIAARRRR